MSRQRFRLGEYYGQAPKYYHAKFDHISHKINSQKKKIPVILLTDIFLVDEHGEKIRLAKNNDFKDKKGRHIIADHLWVKLTKEWFKLPCQLLKGDEIYFQASITKYRINRQDVLNKRDNVWSKALKKNEQIYKRWSKYTDTHKRKNFQLSLDRMKEKQKQNLAAAKAKEAKLELVDYSFNRITKIKILHLIRLKKRLDRNIYNYDQFKRQGYTYSAWLAARSKEFAEHGTLGDNSDK